MKLFKLIDADRLPVNDDFSINWGVIGRRAATLFIIALFCFLIELVESKL